MANVGKVVEKLAPFSTISGNVKGAGAMENNIVIFKKK